MEAVGGAGAEGIDEALLLLFDFGDGVGVEEFAEIGFAEQLAELVLVDGEGLGAAFGERGVAVVEEVGDVAEESEEAKGDGVRVSTTWTRSWRCSMPRRVSMRAGMSKTSRRHSR